MHILIVLVSFIFYFCFYLSVVVFIFVLIKHVFSDFVSYRNVLVFTQATEYTSMIYVLSPLRVDVTKRVEKKR